MFPKLSLILVMPLLFAGSVANAAPTFADSVVSYAPGGSGAGVYEGVVGACAVAQGVGTFDATAVTSLDGCFVALGGFTTGPFGQIVMRFTTGAVVDGAGGDIRLYDTYGYSEGATVEASADGLVFVSLGAAGTDFSVLCSFAAPCATDFDLAGSGLASASYFRITAGQAGAQQVGCVGGFPECYDLDAVEAVNFAGRIPEPSTLALLGLGIVGLASSRRRVQR